MRHGRTAELRILHVAGEVRECVKCHVPACELSADLHEEGVEGLLAEGKHAEAHCWVHLRAVGKPVGKDNADEVRCPL